VKVSKQIAVLTAEENAAWEFAFCFHLEDCDSDQEADRRAWNDLVLEFPRLKKFYGCR